MKINFKKISAIGASVLLTGMTMGSAFALAPSDNAFDAVVYGASADASDTTQANSVSSWLGLSSSTGGGSLSGKGDSYKFEKSSTKYHLGDLISTVISTNVDDDELPTLLAPGTYIDNDNNEFKYKQKITLTGGNQLTMFDDDDYKTDSPTVGFKLTDGTHILNLTLDFTTTPDWDDLASTDLQLAGKTYYVLSTDSPTNTTITLLDSSETVLLSQGDTATVNGKTVTVEYLGSNAVKLNVDGEITKSLAASDTYHLTSGEYVGIKEILYNAVQGSVNKVEFSIGAGKLKLEDTKEVEMNDVDIDNLYVYFTDASSTTELDKITLNWRADDDLFVTPDSEIIMPGFGVVKMSFTGMEYPVEEEIVVTASGDDNFVLDNFPLKGNPDGYDINLLYSNGTKFTLVGKDSNNKIATAGPGGTVTFTKGTHDYFPVSYVSGTDAETYLVRATGFDDTNGGALNETDFEYLVGGSWVSADSSVIATDTVTIGNTEFTVDSVSKESSKTVTLSATASTTNFYQLYSTEGMKVILPWINDTAVSILNNTQYATDAAACVGASLSTNTGMGELAYSGLVTYNLTSTDLSATTSAGCTNYYAATYNLIFDEEDKDDTLGAGDSINVTMALDTSTPKKVYISAVSTDNTDATASEIGETDVFRDFTYSALATEILFDKSDTPDKKVTLVYHGAESTAGVYLTSSDVSAVGSTGSMVFKDSEKSSWEDKNVILVGGSCINTATATALGVASGTCGPDFTAATGVGASEYMIKTLADKFTAGKIALVVAGYDKADTVAGVSKLVNQGSEVEAVDGKEYRGRTGVTGSLAFEELA